MGSRGRLQTALIEERCMHVEDAKMTCVFISQSFDMNNSFMFITAADLLSSPFLQLAKPDLWTAVSSFQHGSMLRSTL